MKCIIVIASVYAATCAGASVLEISAACGKASDKGETPLGRLCEVPLGGGTFSGSGIKGRVVPGGVDRQYAEADGITRLEAEYVLLADDGTEIGVKNSAVATKDGIICSYPVFTAPREGPYRRLNDGVFTAKIDGIKGGVNIIVEKDGKSRILEEGGSGPHKAVMTEAKNLPEHTIFRPKDLTPFSASNPLPVLVWANGACANSPFEHMKFLNEIASFGYLVVATGFLPENDGIYRGPMSRSEQQIESIDWVFAENADPSSRLFRKIDLKHICLAGMSCGGLQTIRNCADARISAVMICNSGLFVNPAAAMPGMPMPGKEKLLDLHTPVIYIMGGKKDIAYENGMDDFRRIKHVPATMANYPSGHAGTFAHPRGGAFAELARAWLDSRFKGKGGINGFRNRGWTVETNGLGD
ncbi:MAG: DUF3237 domain-containing protein [Kiritimatiellae bacterium]|nr:DUF3237 domain-containing protein [Kiritimatiellia bacterium]